MKAIAFTMIVLFSWAASPLRAATTIDPVNKYAYGANIGWMDWSGGTGETANPLIPAHPALSLPCSCLDYNSPPALTYSTINPATLI
jgi:hypothetical protein